MSHFSLFSKDRRRNTSEERKVDRKKYEERKARYSLESGTTAHVTITEDNEVRRKSHPLVHSHHIDISSPRNKAKPPLPPHPPSINPDMIRQCHIPNHSVHVIDSRSKSPTQFAHITTKSKKEVPVRPAPPLQRPCTAPPASFSTIPQASQNHTLTPSPDISPPPIPARSPPPVMPLPLLSPSPPPTMTPPIPATSPPPDMALPMLALSRQPDMAPRIPAPSPPPDMTPPMSAHLPPPLTSPPKPGHTSLQAAQNGPRRYPLLRPAPPPPVDKASHSKHKVNHFARPKKNLSVPELSKLCNIQFDTSQILLPKPELPKNNGEIESKFGSDDKAAASSDMQGKPRSGVDAIYAVVQKKKPKAKKELKEKSDPPPLQYLNIEAEEQSLQSTPKWLTDIKAQLRKVPQKNEEPTTTDSVVEEVNVLDSVTRRRDYDNGYRLLTRSSSYDCQSESIVNSRVAELRRGPSTEALYAIIQKKRPKLKFSIFSPRSRSDKVSKLKHMHDDDEVKSSIDTEAANVTEEDSEYESLKLCRNPHGQFSMSQENDTYAEMHNPHQACLSDKQEDIYIVMSPCAPIILPELKPNLK